MTVLDEVAYPDITAQYLSCKSYGEVITDVFDGFVKLVVKLADYNVSCRIDNSRETLSDLKRTIDGIVGCVQGRLEHLYYEALNSLGNVLCNLARHFKPNGELESYPRVRRKYVRPLEIIGICLKNNKVNMAIAKTINAESVNPAQLRIIREGLEAIVAGQSQSTAFNRKYNYLL